LLENFKYNSPRNGWVQIVWLKETRAKLAQALYNSEDIYEEKD